MLEAVGKAYFSGVFSGVATSCSNRRESWSFKTITIPDQRYASYSKTTDWMRLFIFPGGLLPSLTALTNVLTDQTSLVVKQVDSIGPHYALTLARWKERFLANRANIIDLGFPENFMRRWDYYFFILPGRIFTALY